MGYYYLQSATYGRASGSKWVPLCSKSSYGITRQVQKMVAGERIEGSAKGVSSGIFCQPVSGIGDLWFMHEMGQGILTHV